MKQLLLIYRKLSTKEVVFILKHYDCNNTEIHYLNKNLKSKKLSHYSNKNIFAPSISAKNIASEAIDYIQKIAHLKISKGKTLIELLGDNGDTFWYHIRYIVYNRYKASLLFYYTILATIKHYLPKYQQIVIYHNQQLSNYFFQKEKIVNDSIQFKLPNKTSTLNKNYFGLIKFAITFILRGLLGVFNWNKKSFKKSKHIFFSPIQNLHKIYNPIRNRLELKDSIGGNIIDHFKANKDCYVIEDYYPPKRSELKKNKLKLSFLAQIRFKSTLPFETSILLTLLSFKNYKSIQNFKSRLNINLEIIKKSNVINSEIAIILKSLRTVMILSYIRKIASKKLFKRLNNLKSIGLYDEYSAAAKNLIVEANKKKVMTYAIQHGAIYRTHLGYIYTSNDLGKVTLPDYTLLWGEKFKNLLLTNSIYSKDQLKVFGQLRTDTIFNLRDTESTETLSTFNSKKPIITFASQPLFEGEENIREQLLTDFFKLSKEYKDYQFILKPHPREKEDQYFLNIANKVGSDNFSIFRGDLYHILSITTTVLTYYSTVGAEAVYFNKPLIVFNYNNDDKASYIEEGVAYNAQNFENLKDLLLNVIEKNMRIPQKDLKNYISQNAYKVDGKTTERYINFINQTKT